MVKVNVQFSTPSLLVALASRNSNEMVLLTPVKAALVTVAVAVPLEFAAEVTVGHTMLPAVSSSDQL